MPVPSRIARYVSHVCACVIVVLAVSAPLGAQERTTPTESARATTTAMPVDDPGSGKFHLMLGMYLTAAGTDVSVSMYQIGRGTAREVGFGGWMQDSPVAFSVTKSALTALLGYHLERIHRTRPKLAFTLLAISTGVEVALVARAAGIKGPSPR